MTEAAIVPQGDRGSVLAVAGLFAVNGALVRGIGAALPAMRARLGVDAGVLAVLLVSLPTAAAFRLVLSLVLVALSRPLSRSELVSEQSGGP